MKDLQELVARRTGITLNNVASVSLQNWLTDMLFITGRRNNRYLCAVLEVTPLSHPLWQEIILRIQPEDSQV